MSLLSEYRIRIKLLLAADDVQETLLTEGVNIVGARAIGISKAVVAQKSIARKPMANDDSKDRKSNKD